MRIDRKKLLITMLDQDKNVLQLAEKSGVSRVTISNVKCGKSCSADTVKKIANALNAPVESLVEQ